MPPTSTLAVVAPCACGHGVSLHGPRNFAEHTSALAPCWVCHCGEWTSAPTAADRLLRKVLRPEDTYLSPGGMVIIDPLFIDQLEPDERELVHELTGQRR